MGTAYGVTSGGGTASAAALFACRYLETTQPLPVASNASLLHIGCTAN
jgi:hypothetical protein